MIIAVVTNSSIVRLVYRSEEEVNALLVANPDHHFFFLSTDIPTHQVTPPNAGPHLLADCWCGGS